MDFTWQQEIDLYRKIRSGIILEGNVNDLQPYGSKSDFELVSLDSYLYNYLYDKGYRIIIFFNHIEGFLPYNKPKEFEAFERLYKKIKNETPKNDPSRSEVNTDSSKSNLVEISISKIIGDDRVSKFSKALEIITTLLENKEQPIAFVMNHASRYTTDHQNLTDSEAYLFTELKVALSKRNVPVNPENKTEKLANMVFLVADRVHDLPAWFYLNNPMIRTVNIPQPDREIRRHFIMNNFSKMYGSTEIKDTKEREALIDQFSGITEGINNSGLFDLRSIMEREKIPLRKMRDGVNLLKYGVQENPWDNDHLKRRIHHMAIDLEKRVKGQEEPIQEVTDIITRAIYGMSGLTHSNSRVKPRGIMFFAGPTGTGKTELAKAIAEWIFGTEEAIIRFDMTEFQASQTDQRLLGAPPGYVGYEAGGELTSAVRAKPFSVLLFDEIEKANITILDKFLQILEDGRMTDGRGETVYFSDTIIIFTSNLGMTKKDEKGETIIQAGKFKDNYPGYKKQILDVITDEFKDRIQRPELLNRMGENVIVFKHIYEDVAKRIADRQIERIIERIREDLKIHIKLEKSAKETLYGLLSLVQEKGGRGVSNIMEKHLVNPLARVIAKNKISEGDMLIITQIETVDGVSTLQVQS